MLWLAFRTLLQERGRLIITLAGIVFSAVLTLIEVGIYLGMMGNATSVPTSGWCRNTCPTLISRNPFPPIASTAFALDEVLWAEKIHVWFAFLKLADGRRVSKVAATSSWIKVLGALNAPAEHQVNHRY